MLASTNVLTASPLLGATPSVWTVTGTPVMVRLALAWPVTLPALGDVNVAENWPLALVVPLNGPVGLAAPALELARLIVMDSPAAVTKPLPSPRSLYRVAVNVWGWPTSLVA